jgi:Uracil phosphoribosyltransferase
VDTPLGRASVEFVDPSQPVLVVPIMRAGLVLMEQAATALPCHVTHHFGVARDENTLQPTVYLNKLPAAISPQQRVLVTDPMLATGACAMRKVTMRGFVQALTALPNRRLALRLLGRSPFKRGDSEQHPRRGCRRRAAGTEAPVRELSRCFDCVEVCSFRSLTLLLYDRIARVRLHD